MLYQEHQIIFPTRGHSLDSGYEEQVCVRENAAWFLSSVLGARLLNVHRPLLAPESISAVNHRSTSGVASHNLVAQLSRALVVPRSVFLFPYTH